MTALCAFIPGMPWWIWVLLICLAVSLILDATSTDAFDE